MSMNSQVNVSNVQRQSSLVRGIDGAHRMTPSKHSYHAKRSSDPARFIMGRDLGCASTGTAGGCSVNEQPPRPASVRTTDDASQADGGFTGCHMGGTRD